MLGKHSHRCTDSRHKEIQKRRLYRCHETADESVYSLEADKGAKKCYQRLMFARFINGQAAQKDNKIFEPGMETQYSSSTA